MKEQYLIKIEKSRNHDLERLISNELSESFMIWNTETQEAWYFIFERKS